jgi:hypothetical protein
MEHTYKRPMPGHIMQRKHEDAINISHSSSERNVFTNKYRNKNLHTMQQNFVYLDVASGVETIKLIDNFKHSTLNFIITARSVIKTCTTCMYIGLRV